MAVGTKGHRIAGGAVVNVGAATAGAGVETAGAVGAADAADAVDAVDVGAGVECRRTRCMGLGHPRRVFAG